MRNNILISLLILILCVSTLLFVSCDTPNNNQQTAETPNNEETIEPDDGVSAYPENGAKKIVSQVRNVYSSADSVKEMTFAHYEETPDILLIDTKTACEFVFDSLLSQYGKYEIKETETALTITRDNGAYCVIDFVKDSIYFNNFDMFRTRFNNTMSDILLSSYTDSNGNPIYFKLDESVDIAGDPVYLDLAERDIPLDIYDGKKYIPFQTLNDFFISPFEMNFAFNSKDVFDVSDGTLDPVLEEMYYSIGPKERSQALAQYTANELCLVLDFYYGLQDEHGVNDGFKSYFERCGLWDDLLSTDPTKADNALASLLVGYLVDMQSNLVTSSPYTGDPGLDYDNIKYDWAALYYFDYFDILYAAKMEAMPDGVPGYQEIDNTAYINFDFLSLSYDRFEDYSEQSFEIDDTIGLIMYAHSMINREDSPIENVVIDLSCCKGGYADTTVYLVAWVLGYCNLHLTNPVTNSFSTATYNIDVNLDGVFDKKDSIADKNLYCIVSPSTFSSGNTVASLLKESGMVTLIGDTTAGGGALVQLITTADGSLFTLSNSFLNATVKNGVYYSIDFGVEPHIYFSKFESYFDREALTEYINNLS